MGVGSIARWRCDAIIIILCRIETSVSCQEMNFARTEPYEIDRRSNVTLEWPAPPEDNKSAHGGCKSMMRCSTRNSIPVIEHCRGLRNSIRTVRCRRFNQSRRHQTIVSGGIIGRVMNELNQASSSGALRRERELSQ